MAVLHVKSPNGTQTDLDLSKIVLTDTVQSISGKTFDNVIRFDTLGEIGIMDNAHDVAKPLRQLVLSSTTIDNWSGEGAIICLHNYDSTGTNELEDGAVVLHASDGSNASDLVVYDDNVAWNYIPISINSKGSDWIRYDNGIQICWCGGSSAYNIPYHLTYPMPFINLPAISICNGSCAFTNWEYTGCVIVGTHGLSGGQMYVSYMAIGRWK